ncbi:MAG: ABC-ATPase domain-containing protein [Actinomycetaceae bacterium]|nr:ABC-ATPase domain-containing protein [Actinomycetaceae bacterium]
MAENSFHGNRSDRYRSAGTYRGDRDTRGRGPARSHREFERRPHREFERRSGSDQDLIDRFHEIDGRNYGQYKSVIGDYDYGDFTLHIDRVQSDPYAPPSQLRATSNPKRMGIPEDLLQTRDQRLAVADFLAREFARNSAKSQEIRIARCGQEILERSYASVDPTTVELRFQCQFPARGRTILGRSMARLADVDIPYAVMDTFDFISEDAAGHLESLRKHVETYVDYRALQAALTENNWIGFVANNSTLARRSGISDLPMDDSVTFTAPESLAQTVTLPHAGEVTGMALKPGITVIVGGGYHGKSTLLNALQRGVYAHVPGDGRELVAIAPDAVKVRAEDGRAVTSVDVSAFINDLPGGAETTSFSTENASGSTSQAASIVEAVELGCPVLLVDEDTSATNLMIRDERMRELVADDKEPITPFVDRIGGLSAKGVSTILVMGGSGDYLDVADLVLMMDNYEARDVTGRAREVVEAQPRERSDVSDFPEVRQRVPMPLKAHGGKAKTKSKGLDNISLDRQDIDVSDVEQIVDSGQTEAIAWAIRALTDSERATAFDGETTLSDALDRLEEILDQHGLDGLGGPAKSAFMVRPRRVDVAAALNRYRSLRVS